MKRTPGVWIHSHNSGLIHEVRYASMRLARFTRRDCAEKYRDWVWERQECDKVLQRKYTEWVQLRRVAYG